MKQILLAITLVSTTSMSANAQSRLYTNADLNKPVKYTRTVTPEELAGLVARQFPVVVFPPSTQVTIVTSSPTAGAVNDVQPVGPQVLILNSSSTAGPFGEFAPFSPMQPLDSTLVNYPWNPYSSPYPIYLSPFGPNDGRHNRHAGTHHNKHASPKGHAASKGHGASRGHSATRHVTNGRASTGGLPVYADHPAYAGLVAPAGQPGPAGQPARAGNAAPAARGGR
jgi:hypothetical protein